MSEGRDDHNTEVYIPSADDHVYAESYDPETGPYVDFMAKKPKKSRSRLVLTSLGVLVIAVAGYFLVTHFTGGNDTQKMSGNVAMSAGELRSLVAAQHLTAYWAGPMDGAKYALIVKPNQIFVRYLPNGQGLADKTTSYRVIATYTQKNAFLITQSAGAVTGNVGFTNVDGNAVFYVKTRPTNVYMGIKGKDIQLEIFDPGIDQALGLSLLHNQIQLIG